MRQLVVYASLVLIFLVPVSSVSADNQTLVNSDEKQCRNTELRRTTRYLRGAKRQLTTLQSKNVSRKRLRRVRNQRRSLAKVRKTVRAACKGGVDAFSFDELKTSSQQGEVFLTGTLPDSPIYFSELNPGSNGNFSISVTGNGFRRRMWLFVVSEGAGNAHLYPFSYVSANEIKIAVTSPVEGNISLYLIYTSSKNNQPMVSDPLFISLKKSKPAHDKDPDPGDKVQPEPKVPPGIAIGDHIATLSHDSPPQEYGKYILHATLPLQDIAIPPAVLESGYAPVVLRDPLSKELYPAQVTGLVRGPSGGFTTIKLSSLVSNSTNPINEFEVLVASNQMPPKPVGSHSIRSAILSSGVLSPSSAALFQNPGRLKLEAQDVHGNTYSCDITEQPKWAGVYAGNVEIDSFGPLHFSARTFCVMTHDPLQGTFGTVLNRLLDVGVFWEVDRAEGDTALRLTLNVGNTLSGSRLNGDVPIATMHNHLPFRYLHLVVDGDVSAQYPEKLITAGDAVKHGAKTIIPLIRENIDGSVHILPRFRIFPQVVTIAPSTVQGNKAIAFLNSRYGIAFARKGASTTGGQPLFSPFSSGIGPVRLAWPVLDQYSHSIDSMRQQSSNLYASHKLAAENGTCGGQIWMNQSTFGAPACFSMGYYGGETSGTDLSYNRAARCAATRSRECVLHEELWARGYISRMNFLTQLNGRPTQLENAVQSSWTFQDGSSIEGNFLPLFVTSKVHTGHEDVHKNNKTAQMLTGEIFDSAITSHLQAVASQGLWPAYASIVAEDTAPGSSWHSIYQPQDAQHRIRTTATYASMLEALGTQYAKTMLEYNGAMALLEFPPAGVFYHYSTWQNQGWLYKSGSMGNIANAIPPVAGIGNAAIGRDTAHVIAAQVYGAAVSSDNFYRGYLKPHFRMFIEDVLHKAQIAPIGTVQLAKHLSKISEECYAARSNEEAFLAVTLRMVMQSFFAGQDALLENKAQQVLSGIAHANIHPDVGWNNAPADQNKTPGPYADRMTSTFDSPENYFLSLDEMPLECQQKAAASLAFYDWLLSVSAIGEPSKELLEHASLYLNYGSGSSLKNKLLALAPNSLFNGGSHSFLLAYCQNNPGKCD